MLLRTRHSIGFDIVTDVLDRNKSPYTENYEGYTAKCNALAVLIGQENYIWCVPEDRPFEFYESEKPVEWLIDVDCNRILGYVDEGEWLSFLNNDESHLPGSVFSESQPASGIYSVIVPCPLKENEILKKTVFNYKAPKSAEVVEEIHYKVYNNLLRGKNGSF